MHDSSESGGSAGRTRSAPLLLAGVVAACYANSFAVPFQFDDPQPDKRLAFTFRPLVSATFALNRALSGEAVWSFHAFNVLVHLACGLVLLGVLRRTLERAAPQIARGTRAGLALASSLAWLVHPLQTGAVTYLSQRAESLGAFFYLLCLYAFVRSTTAARPLAWQALVVLALALGFAAKETIATAPVALLLYDATFVEPGGLAGALRRRKPLYGVLACVAVALSIPLIVPQLLAERTTMGFRLHDFGPLEYARSQPGVLLHYLRLCVWPHPLVFDYGWPIAKELGDWLPQTLVVAAILCVTGVLVARRSWIGFASAWFFVILLPTSSLVPIKDLAFEHRVYLSLAGVVVPVVVGAWWLCGRLLPAARFLPHALCAALVLALAATTVRRNRDYRSPAVLWQTVVERAPGNARGYSNLATALKDEGRGDQTIALLNKAIELDPAYHSAYHKLGNAYLLRGELATATDDFRRSIALYDCSSYRYGLACALLAQGAFAEAEAEYRKALAFEPEDAGSHLGLGNALAQLERKDEAALEYREALRLDPRLQSAHTNLAVILEAQGNPAEALEHHLAALALPPGTFQEQFNLGKCLVLLGRNAEALEAFRAAMRLAPAMPEPPAALAKALLSKGDASAEEKAEALQLATKANDMTSSKRADILETLAMAHAANADPGSAVELVQKALELPGPTRNAAFRERLLAQLQEYRRAAGL